MAADRSWEHRLCDLFDDLEQQAEGLHLLERDAEVADRSRAEYSQVTMAARLNGSVGERLVLRLLGVGRLEGTLMRVGSDWFLLNGAPWGQGWMVRTAAVVDASGLSERAVTEPARSVVSRLGLGSALRGVTESGSAVVLEHLDGNRQRGTPVRVGADFVEIGGGVDGESLTRGTARTSRVLPFAALAAVREA